MNDSTLATVGTLAGTALAAKGSVAGIGAIAVSSGGTTVAAVAVAPVVAAVAIPAVIIGTAYVLSRD
ncbi:hypothetical protein NIES2119_31825 [[Phormidium ambiguum] IAM M-71]|uniref:Uncharacterized protein n=1 Tax=[Phormidium ambiguum] IAM M-71 TaxID=454136 RepID=A0A1U7I1G9_9CYAN|nr:hypothetical protein [Phormidium ambiguum]OKH29876.1 hypothetical protein NIES2119_31825 [Phormidium ambiguum IAM M-71]